MYASVHGAVMQGMTPRFIQVEADLSDGLPGLQLIGDLSAGVRESGSRVRTALLNAGIPLPPRRIIINLAPADLRKQGASFDLPIAVAIAAVTQQIPISNLTSCLIIGEVGLDGRINSVPGILPVVRAAVQNGFQTCIVPLANLEEGRLIPDITVIGVSHLSEVLAFLRHGVMPKVGEKQNNFGEKESPLSEINCTDIGTEYETAESEERIPSMNDTEEKGIHTDRSDVHVRKGISLYKARLDFSEIRGQEALKRASLIAAAGFHNLLIVGPPGAGKTMAASRIPYILPPMSRDEQLEVTEIHSVAGLLKPGNPLVRERTCRSPHHTITGAGLVGGGVIPKPGEATLAHKGVLFLDELTEFHRPVLELLRQPLEEHEIHLTRSGGSMVYPADFLFVGAMNPCPCGYYPDMNRCRCTEQEVKRYRSRISGPLLDRIDLCVTASRVNYEDLAIRSTEEIIAEGVTAKRKRGSDDKNTGLTSEEMYRQVQKVWQIQQQRYAGESYAYNGRIPARDLSRWCTLTREAEQILKLSYEKLELSARAYHRILRTARTIADLHGETLIGENHIMEAIGYRCFECE